MRETCWIDRTIEFREDGKVEFTIPTPAPENRLRFSERKRFYAMARRWCSGAGKVEILETEAFGRL